MNSPALMRPELPAEAQAWPAPEESRRRLVQNAQPEHERRSAVQPRTFVPFIPLPPRVPKEATDLLRDILGPTEAPVQLDFDTAPAEDDDDTAALVPAPRRDQVRELQEAGNRLLEEGRAARRALGVAECETRVWRERAFTLEMALRRLDPVWGRS